MNVILMVIISGFSIGILGSFHCVGMCGPLALTLPINNLSGISKITSILIYNIGRVLSYTFMGIFFGIIGQSFSFFSIQRWLSITAGILILAILLSQYLGNPQSNIIIKFTNNIKHKLGTYLKTDKKLISYLNIGILNGFLPCGLVYIAIATAISTGSILKSSILMLAFGFGTFPLMALTMIFGKFISFRMRNGLNKITPYLIMCIAFLLILRGLNLGIPYISPAIINDHATTCH